jgi:N,N'-diacetylchitobiose transport system permease protein
MSAVSTPLATGGTASATPPPAAGSRRGRRRGGFTPAVLLLPAIAVLAVITGWPLIQLIVMSFQSYGRAQVFGQPPEFVALANYGKVLTDPQFWAVLGRSLGFCLVAVSLTVVGATLIALLMRQLNRFFRTLVAVGLLLAWAMPPLSATIVWGWLFDTQYGVVNYLLDPVWRMFGGTMVGHSWLTDPVSFFGVLTIIVVWGAIPFVAFAIYAGIGQVPEEVMEASALDGAGAARRFFLIVFPYLRSVFVVVVVLSVIWDVRVFTQVKALQDIGGSINETATIGVYIYQVALGNAHYDIGGAIAVLMVLMLLAVSFVYIRQLLKEEESA